MSNEVESNKDTFNFEAVVREAVTAAQPSIRDAVVKIYVEKELDARKEALLKAFESLRAAQVEVRKIKPDTETFNGDGTVLSSGYSKTGLEALKQAKEKLARIEKEIFNALNHHDYTGVLKLNKG